MIATVKTPAKLIGLALFGIVAFFGVRQVRSLRRTGQPFEVGQCTWYAFERAGESGWRIRFDHPWGRNARSWPERVTNAALMKTPAPGEVMVLNGWPGNEYGHVAYVESVQDADHWTVSHANMAAGSDYRTLAGVVIRLAKVSRQGDRVVFDGRAGAFSLVGFLSRKS